jgi:hypothetical protein
MRFLIGDAFLKITGVTTSLRGDEDEGDTEEENALPFSIVTLTVGDQALRYTDKHPHGSQTSRVLSSALQDGYVTLDHVTLHISIQ